MLHLLSYKILSLDIITSCYFVFVLKYIYVICRIEGPYREIFPKVSNNLVPRVSHPRDPTPHLGTRLGLKKGPTQTVNNYIKGTYRNYSNKRRGVN